MKKKIFLTGATGVFGSETLKRLLENPDEFEVTILARPSKKNKKKLSKYEGVANCNIIWGNLLNFDDVKKGVDNADMVLHVGGMVSPAADYYPQQTLKTNVESMRNIIKAVKSKPNPDDTAIIYIGSVSQYGPRTKPLDWCRAGDPMIAAEGDYYAVSKILAERELAESGLKRWASLRQTGILYPELIMKGTDPISFHVPLNGVLEWATKEQSGRLLAEICRSDIPETFWRRFYNIGGGESFRMTNYEFEKRLMKVLHCPPPEKVFEPNWFATRNFHGAYFTDSDDLERMFPFRGEGDSDSYFKHIADASPSIFSMAAIVPAGLIKAGMKLVAKKKGLGTLNWISENNEKKIHSYFKSRADWERILSWENYQLVEPSKQATMLNHGYDETKPLSELDIEDMRKAAEFRGGKCLSETMTKGEMWQPLEWECSEGHRFTAMPGTILLGGHWCDKCMPPEWRYNALAKKNPFLAQAWYNTHDLDETDL